MNAKTAKLLRKYAHLRGYGSVMNYKIMKSVFLNASKEEQKKYIQEFENYIQAIKDKRLKPGEKYHK